MWGVWNWCHKDGKQKPATPTNLFPDCAFHTRAPQHRAHSRNLTSCIIGS